MMLLGDIKLAMIEACMQHICDKGLTPYLQVQTQHPEYEGMATDHPTGAITLNIGGTAVTNFYVDEEAMSFNYSGNGKRAVCYIPLGAIASIYAKEDTSMWQPFVVESVDTSPESVKVPTKPIRKGFHPRIV